MELMFMVKGKEYTSTDSKRNYLYLTDDGVMHAVDGAKFAFEYSATGAIVAVEENEIIVKNGYPQHNGSSIIVHGLKDGGLVVQYGSTKETRNYKTVPYVGDANLTKIATAYDMLLKSK